MRNRKDDHLDRHQAEHGDEQDGAIWPAGTLATAWPRSVRTDRVRKRMDSSIRAPGRGTARPAPRAGRPRRR
jgi:hypothetical protein